MDKVFEALAFIKEKFAYLEYNCENYNIPKEELDILQNALLELKAIKEAKPSEALDKLEECANGMKDLPKSNWSDLAESEAELDLKVMDWVETIEFELFKGKQALLKADKLEKAWKIVKEKNVDVSLLNYCEYYTEYNVEIERHNDKLKIYQGWWYRNELTQQEFDLLKEVL